MKTYIKNIEQQTRWIKQEALRLGFDYCGIAAAQFLEDDAPRLEQWLKAGMHGKMSYLERNFDKRLDPRLLVDGAKSMITLMLNYFPSEEQVTDNIKISKYAYGHDYHDVIREKLNLLLSGIQENIGTVNGRGFVDSAPVLERSWAKMSGLGWVGKNGNLITKKNGSYFFLATLIVDIPLIYDDPFAKDFCGTCTKCIDACPTNAILGPAIVDGSKCISYLTIELKDEILPNEFQQQMQQWAFGCDVCQDVCPWNRFSTPHNTPEFKPLALIADLKTQDWLSLTEDAFKVIFKHSPIKRSKFKGIQRNLKFVLNID